MVQNTRLLTQSNSKLAKADVVKLLAQEEAWSSLPEETQRSLYATLPPPRNGIPLDHGIHPFKTEYSQFVKHFLHEWQNDLKEGRNTLKWRNEASQASGERAAGIFDHVLALEREEKWGKEKLDTTDFKKACGEDGSESEERLPASVKQDGENESLESPAASDSVEQDGATEKLEMGIFAGQQAEVDTGKSNGITTNHSTEEQAEAMLDSVNSSGSEVDDDAVAMPDSVGSIETKHQTEEKPDLTDPDDLEKSERRTNKRKSDNQAEDDLDPAISREMENSDGSNKKEKEDNPRSEVRCLDKEE